MAKKKQKTRQSFRPAIAGNWTRRDFLRFLAGGFISPYMTQLRPPEAKATAILNDLFWVKNIPDDPFYNPAKPNLHLGLDSLLYLMAEAGLKFYQSKSDHYLAGPQGLIAPDDIVLIKVNAQWKYRGCTNSDLIRGLVERILSHPDGFAREVVILENGQGRGSLACDTSAAYGDSSVRANANDERHSFIYLVNNIFNDRRVSYFLLDPVRSVFISQNDHMTNGYRRFEDVSYPCFTTAGGHRVELREGVWQGGTYSQNLKLINVPVLKHHDTGGSEITASLKHFYGLVSMADGYSGYRHYSGLGETCGKMIASVITPVLNIIDAIWVSHGSLTGYPAATTFRANQLLASQDPVALDYWAAKYILYPIDNNARHHPDFPGIEKWLTAGRDMINSRGGLKNVAKGIVVDRVTKNEGEMNVRRAEAGDFLRHTRLSISEPQISLVFAGSRGAKIKTKEISLSFPEDYPFSWWTEASDDWLSVIPPSGLGNSKLMVQVNASGLDPGKYSGSIFIHCLEAANSPFRLPVNLLIIS